MSDKGAEDWTAADWIVSADNRILDLIKAPERSGLKVRLADASQDLKNALAMIGEPPAPQADYPVCRIGESNFYVMCPDGELIHVGGVRSHAENVGDIVRAVVAKLANANG